MKANSLLPIRSTGIQVPKICFGTTALGNMPDTYSYEVDEKRAIETIIAILTSSTPFIDTSRIYGAGRSEQRMGLAIRELGGLPDHAIVSTKLDRDLDSGIFDAAQARRSLEESLEAMGIDHIDILHLHDPEHAESLDLVTRSGGAIDELYKMRDEGLCKAIGLAAGKVDVMLPILKSSDFDCIITHNRHTLVNANGKELIDYADANNIAVFNAAPYCGGALAKGTASVKRYVYQEVTEQMLNPLRAVEAVCDKYNIPPGAAALQYSMRDSRISSTICGVSKPERIAQTLEWANYPISDEAWKDLLAIPRTSDDPEATREYTPG